MGTTKHQRKLKKLRNEIKKLKIELNVEEIAFFPVHNMLYACKSPGYSLNNFDNLNDTLDYLQKAINGQIKVHYLVDDIMFDNIDEFRRYILIQKIAGVKL